MRYYAFRADWLKGFLSQNMTAKVAGHSDRDKTTDIELICRNFWWSGMEKEIVDLSNPPGLPKG